MTALKQQVSPALELGENQFLMIEGEKLREYCAVLNCLGFKLSLEDIETGFVRVSIDRRGFSPELETILGENYLGDMIVIVDEHQGNLGCSDPFINMILDRFYDYFDPLVQRILPKKPLVGYVFLERYLDHRKTCFLEVALKNELSLIGIGNAHLDIDTPDSDIRKALDVIEETKLLEQEPEKHLNFDFYSKEIIGRGIIERVAQLVPLLGPLDEFEDFLNNRTDVIEELPSFKYISRNGTIYLIKGKKGKVQVMFNSSGVSCARYTNTYPSRNIAYVVSNLFLEELITKKDTENCLRFLKAYEITELEKAGYKIAGNGSEDGLKDESPEYFEALQGVLTKRQDEVWDYLDPVWDYLRELAYSGKGNLGSLDGALQIGLIQVNPELEGTEKSLVEDLLGRLEDFVPPEYKRKFSTEGMHEHADIRLAIKEFAWPSSPFGFEQRGYANYLDYLCKI